MPKVTPEPDSTGGESIKKGIRLIQCEKQQKKRREKSEILRPHQFPQPVFSSDQSHQIKVSSQFNRWIVLRF
jgi:hypothetical protein